MTGNNIRSAVAKALAVIGVFAVVVAGVATVAWPAGNAQAGINTAINFQGKLVNSDGTNIPNGTYNLEFKLYTGGNGCVGGGSSPCSGTLQWTEDWLRNSSHGVTVTDGVFQVDLGSITSLPAIFNNATIWLSINLGNSNATCTPFSSCSGDGEMLPFMRFDASPYALNSDLLDGLDSSAFAQLSPGSAQSGFLNVTGNVTSGATVAATTSLQAPLVDTASAVALAIGGTNATSVTLGKTTTPFTIQGNSSSTFTATNGANTTTVSFTTPTGTNAINFPNAGGTLCTTTASTCSTTYQVAGSYLAKNAADTSSFSVTAANYLYGFTNSNSAIASGVLKLDNGSNTADGLLVTASGNASAGNALVVVNSTGSSGNVLDLQKSAVSQLAVDVNGNVSQNGGTSTTRTLNGQTISAAASFTGTVTAATSLLAPLVDTASAGVLAIGTNNATAINLNQNTAVANNKSLTAGGAATFQDATASTTALQVQTTNANNLFTADTSTTPNLITDGDFEQTGTPGWSSRVSATLSRSTAHQQQGNASLSVATTTSAGSGAQYNFAFGASTTYSVSFYAKLSAGSMSTFEFGHSNDTGGADVSCATGQTLNTTWQRFTCSWTTSGTVSGTRYLYLKQTDAPGAGRTILVDAVQLEVAAAPTAFSPGGALQLEGLVDSPLNVKPLQDSTQVLQVQTSGGTTVFNVDTVNSAVNANTITPTSALTVGATGQSFLLQGNASSTITATNGANTTTVSFTTPTTTRSIIFPDAGGTVCLTSQNCSTAGTGYILNQSSTPGVAQTGNFNISGTGIAGTALVSPSLDTSAAATLSLGTGNANNVSIGSVGSTAKGTAVHINDTTDATNTQTVTIGSTAANTADVTTIQGGSSTTGAIVLTPNNAGAILVGAAAGTGNITLGSSSAAESVLIANGGGAPTVGIANASVSGATVNIAGAANTSANVVNIANGASAANTTVSILSGVGTAGTGTLSLGNNTRVTTIDLGNVSPAAARTTTIAGGGTGVVDTVNIATGAATVANGKTVNIATGTPTGTGSNTVTIGSTALSSTTNLQAGTGNTNVLANNANVAAPIFSIQQAGAGDASQEYRDTSTSFYSGVDASAGHLFVINSKAAATDAATTTLGQDYSSQVPNGTDNNATQIQATKFTASATGSLSQISIAIDSDQTGDLFSVGIFADNGSGTAPVGLLGQYTGTKTPVISNPGSINWNTITLDAPVSITSGTVYWLALETNTANLFFKQRTGAGASSIYRSGVTTGTWANPWASNGSANTTSGNEIGIYGTIVGSTALADTFASPLFTLSQTGQLTLKNITNSSSQLTVQNAAGTTLLQEDSLNGQLGVYTATLFKNNANSATALQVQTSTGTNLLVVDTTTPAVKIGATGTSTSASTIDIADTSNATGTQTITVGSSAKAANAVSIEAGNTGKIQIGNSTAAHTIQIGNGGTAAQAVTIGSTSSTSTTTINGGVNGTTPTVSLQAAASGVIALGTTNANTIQIGAVGATANADTIHIADSTGATQVITIGGSGANNGSAAGTTVKLQGGQTSESIANAGDTIQTFTNSATAFQIQNATSSNILKVGTTAVRTNFITNPGGEAAVTASDWPTGGNGTAVTVSQDTSNALSGLGSIKAITTGTANRGAKNVLSATLASSTAYSLTFYAKASGSNFATLSADYLYDGTNSDGTVTCSGLAVVIGGWTRYSCFFTTSASGTHTKTASNAIVLMQTDAASRTWYMDGVLLEQISSTADAYGAGQAQLDAVITGPIAVQNTENSTTALTVVSAAGSALLTADTLNSKVTVGGTAQLGASAGSGALVNNGSTLNTADALGDLASGSMGTAASTVDVYTYFTIAPTASGRSYTVQPPTGGVAGRVIYISNVGANSFTIVATSSVLINPNVTATLVYNGAAWTYAGADSSSLQAAYNNSAGGTTPSIAVSTVKSAVTIQNSVTNSIGAGTELFGVRSAAANDTTLGNSLLTVTSYGVGVNLGSDSAVSGNDLQFGGNADRVIRVISATTANQIGGALTVAAGAANGTSTGAAGGQLNLNGGNAAGTNSNNGGAVAIQGGTASNNATSVGGGVTIQGGTAGATAGSTGGVVTINGGAGTGTGTGAGGSAVNINGGNAAGSNSNTGGTIGIQGGTGSTNGNGGAVTVQGGTAAGTGTGGTLNINGGSASATAGSIGGALALTSGAGANGSGATNGGISGAVTINSGNAGAGTGTNSQGGNAGDVTFTAGSGGASTGSAANSNGGSIRLTAGAAGSGGSGANGTPGIVSIDSPVFTSVTETFTQSGNNQTFTTGTDPTLQTNVDGFGTIVVTVSGAFTGASITMPAPRNTSAGHLLYIVATQASASFTLTSTNMPSFSVAAGDTATLVWNGSNWTAGVAASSLQQVYNSTSTSPASIVTTSTAKTLLVQAGAGFDSSSLLTVSNANGAALWNIDTTNPITDITNNANNNEVTNGSFESTTAVTGWVKMGAAQVAVAQDTSQASAGSASMKVVTTSGDTAGTDGAKYNLTTSTLVSNTQYTMSFYARTQAGFSGSSWATMEIGHADNGSTNTSCLTAQTVVATGWTRYTCSFTTGTTSGTPYVYIRETDASTHNFWVDGVTLQRWSILSNASVEQALTASDWVKKTGSETTTAQSATQHFDGADSLQVVTTAAVNQGTKHNITLNDSTTYTLQFEAINTGAAFTDMEAGYSSDGSTDNTPCVTGQTVGASFTAFTCTFTTPSSHSGTPFFYVKQAAATAHTFFIDAVQLNVSNPLTSAYQEGKLQLGGTIISPMVLQNQTDSTTALLVQNAAATSTLLTVDTLDSVVRLGDSTNNATFSSTRELTLNGTARHSKTIRLNAEYVGAVLDSNGAASILGTMTAAFDSTQRMGYYKWTTSQATAQSYDIVVTMPVPDDWSSWTGNPTFKVYTSGGTGYIVSATITKSDGTADASYNAFTMLDGSHNNTTATWLTISNPNGATYTNNTTAPALAGTGYSAGGIMNIRIHLVAAPPVSNVAQEVRVGDIYLPYLSKY